MGELTATKIYLVRRHLIEALISLEDIENEMRQEMKGESMPNRELMEQIYAQAEKEKGRRE